MSYSQGPSYYGNGVNDSGGGGGGFLSPMGSQNSPGDGSKKTAQHSLRPLTILAMHDAQQAHGEANFTVDDVEIGQVTVVAQVIQDRDPNQTTNMLFRLDDGTALIDARHWLETHESPDDFSHITAGSFVRILGSLKQIGSKRHLAAPTIRLATPKEFLFHKAEVMLVWAQVTLPPPAGQPGVVSHTIATGGDASVYTSGGGHAPQTDMANYAHLPLLERRILEVMRAAPPREEGIHLNNISGKLSSESFDAGSISQALDRLMDDGHVFTTIDDNHFQIA
ncbi:replication protein A, subunit RPA32 [Ramaria rubella]|nr:replication protein A, subunit RPA32 [Ramaria rubella]